ncbi:MAG: peroxiredoxin [Acidiferrobacterales bacterium]|nr:peroxiredoxin [Acidiferrobacterales bacterium]
MTIAVGDRIPDVTLYHMTDDGPAEIRTSDIFDGKKVLLFAVPGAYTPTCSKAHLPGYVVNADAIKAKGVDTIACLAVNDVFVMGAWGEVSNAENILMLADGSAKFTAAVGIELDLTDRGLGMRSDRYAMIVEDGVVTALNREGPGKFEVSDADTMMGLI